jgi:sulfur carrier protein
MVLTINGEQRDVSARTVPDLLAELGYEGSFYAVAVNHSVVPRRQWSGRRLEDGDRIEIVTPRRGG